MRFSDMVVMVTGAGRGIGKAIAERFASEGAVAAVCDMSLETAEETAAAITAAGGKAEAFEMNVQSSDQIQTVIDRLIEKHGNIDVLVNNAGITIPGPVVDFQESDWDLMIDINLKGRKTAIFSLCGHKICGYRFYAGSRHGIGAVWNPGKCSLSRNSKNENVGEP